MGQKLKLASVPLVVVKALHLRIGLDGVAADKKIDVKGLIEGVLQLK